MTVLFLSVVVVLAGGCAAGGDDASAGGDPAVATSEVQVDDDVFVPEAVEVAAGTEVTWTWQGSNAHNVTADGFASETQTSGTFSHTFDRAGTYPYAVHVASGHGWHRRRHRHGEWRCDMTAPTPTGRTLTVLVWLTAVGILFQAVTAGQFVQRHPGRGASTCSVYIHV